MTHSSWTLLLLVGTTAFPEVQDQAPRPEDPESPVHPRKFGSPGGVGTTRGWYVWHSWNPATWQADVSPERAKEHYTVRVLPWLTTYRHLAYGADPGDLLPGERVNLFFNPEGAEKRAYLVHYQDEIGQMKGHGHSWQVEDVAPSGRGFSARVMHLEAVFDPVPGSFELDPQCRLWRGGKRVDQPSLSKGDRLYLTWCDEDGRRIVKTMADGQSLDALQGEGRARVRERIAREGMGAFLEEVSEGKGRLLIFATHWEQASAIKPGQKLMLRGTDASYRPAGEGVQVSVESRKNLGAYGSGSSEIMLSDLTPETCGILRGWKGGKVIRVFLRE